MSCDVHICPYMFTSYSSQRGLLSRSAWHLLERYCEGALWYESAIVQYSYKYSPVTTASLARNSSTLRIVFTAVLSPKLQRNVSKAVSVGWSPGQVLPCVVVVWRSHRGRSVPGVFTERSGGPLVTLNFCVMRRYKLGEGDLVSTFLFILFVETLYW